MRIGDVARQVGVNPKTIRYYESIGLLPEPARTSSGYRDYGPDDVDRLTFARRAADMDLRLNEIAEILALRDGGERPCDYVLDIARQRVDELGERIDRLHQTRLELTRLLERAPTAPTEEGYCQLIEHRADPGPEEPSP